MKASKLKLYAFNRAFDWEVWSERFFKEHPDIIPAAQKEVFDHLALMYWELMCYCAFPGDFIGGSPSYEDWAEGDLRGLPIPCEVDVFKDKFEEYVPDLVCIGIPVTVRDNEAILDVLTDPHYERRLLVADSHNRQLFELLDIAILWGQETFDILYRITHQEPVDVSFHKIFCAAEILSSANTMLRCYVNGFPPSDKQKNPLGAGRKKIVDHPDVVKAGLEILNNHKLTSIQQLKAMEAYWESRGETRHPDTIRKQLQRIKRTFLGGKN